MVTQCGWKMYLRAERASAGSCRPALRVKSRIGADIPPCSTPTASGQRLESDTCALFGPSAARQLLSAGAIDSASACVQAGEAPGSGLEPVPALARPVTKPIRKPAPAPGRVVSLPVTAVIHAGR